MQIGNLTEKQSTQFQKWIKGHLAAGEISVIFTKKDGTERIMKCTTSPTLVPAVPLNEAMPHVTNTDNPIDFPKPKKKVNTDVMPVYDLESKAWKSFRWDSVKSVVFTIGDEVEHTDKA